MSKLRTSKKIYVCTQLRYTPNSQCCGKNGGPDLILILGEYIKSHSLEIEVIQSNCMLMCSKGPNIKLLPEGKVWNQVTTNSIPEIISYLKNNP